MVPEIKEGRVLFATVKNSSVLHNALDLAVDGSTTGALMRDSTDGNSSRNLAAGI